MIFRYFTETNKNVYLEEFGSRLLLLEEQRAELQLRLRGTACRLTWAYRSGRCGRYPDDNMVTP